MRVFIIAALGLLASAFPTQNEHTEVRDLEARVNCGQNVPSCSGGSVLEAGVSCPCQDLAGPCDLWQCPGDESKRVSFFMSYLSPSSFSCYH